MKWLCTWFSSGGRILDPWLARSSTKSTQFLNPRVVKKSSSSPVNVIDGFPSANLERKGENDWSAGHDGEVLVDPETFVLESWELVFDSWEVDWETITAVLTTLRTTKSRQDFIVVEWVMGVKGRYHPQGTLSRLWWGVFSRSRTRSARFNVWETRVKVQGLLLQFRQSSFFRAAYSYNWNCSEQRVLGTSVFPSCVALRRTSHQEKGPEIFPVTQGE